jgi:probable F420-dependent oxidoreductase
MDFGVFMFDTDDAIDVVSLSRAAEERGFESVFVPEHSHIPVEFASAPPMGGQLPREYYRLADPFVALAAAAVATERIRLGTAICLVVERDPIHLAKQVASLDRLSGGRLLFGVGAGWNVEEMANHGTDPTSRFALLRERVEAMQTIWRDDEAEYHGTFVDFDPIFSWPKPVQRPWPPVLVGGAGERVLERVVRYGDGWIPNVLSVFDVLEARVSRLRELSADAGRDRPSVTLMGEGSGPDARLGRDPDPAVLERFVHAGVDRCLFRLPPAPADEVLPILDHLAGVVSRFGTISTTSSR